MVKPFIKMKYIHFFNWFLWKLIAKSSLIDSWEIKGQSFWETVIDDFLYLYDLQTLKYIFLCLVYFLPICAP